MAIKHRKNKSVTGSKAKPLSLHRRVRRNIFNLTIAGQRLSNIAYNWAQDTNRPESDRKMLKESQERWDAARNKVPRWVHCA